MPLQGQWERQHTPIRALPQRTRRTLAIVAAILVSATAAIVAFALVHSDSAGAGCIRLTLPSTMGAGYVHACGGQAERTCKEQLGRSDSDPFARAAHAECRRAGFPAPAAS
jgi:protein-S-isoprenylcysteine O-methyltransferase Ste14